MIIYKITIRKCWCIKNCMDKEFQNAICLYIITKFKFIFSLFSKFIENCINIRLNIFTFWHIVNSNHQISIWIVIFNNDCFYHALFFRISNDNDTAIYMHIPYTTTLILYSVCTLCRIIITKTIVAQTQSKQAFIYFMMEK